MEWQIAPKINYWRHSLLLCLSFNGLCFNRTKINSTLIHKQKAKIRKPKWIIVLIIRLGFLANLVWSLKPRNGFLIESTDLTSHLPNNWLRQLSEFLAPKNGCPENSAHKSKLADKHRTEKPREQGKTIKHWFCVIKHNAALRGECRINQAPADHFHHQNSL